MQSSAALRLIKSFGLMTNSSKPISSHDSVAAQMALDLQKQLSLPAVGEVDVRAAVVWYMRYGYSRVVNRESLISALGDLPELQRLAETLTPEVIAQGKPLPEFMEGQKVEVIVNAKNVTYHSGTVQSLNWHHKEGRWMYYLLEDGKRVAKRYEARDLRLNEA
jgi:hypothetical protein